MFHTKSLLLRAFRDSDLDNIIALYNHQRVVSLISSRFPVPRGDKLKEEYRELINNSTEMFCVLELPEDSSFVGFTTLLAQSERGHRLANFAVVLKPDHWNKGYGSEVVEFMLDHGFRCLNLHRIALDVYDGNERANAVYKRFGFVEEGRRRKERWVDGGWRDTIQMGILAEEWAERKSKLESMPAEG
ncbi:acyl-CoA N-acyltransferase [Crassisporium funariophilum]|nr:acyl-CoA N-acyltransferase [Crassisporium funariophilum]